MTPIHIMCLYMFLWDETTQCKNQFDTNLVKTHYAAIEIFSCSALFLAQLARRAIVSFCHTKTSVVRHPSTLENKYSNIFFYKITGPTVLKFHMKHDLTPGYPNCKIGSGQISKIAAITKNSKNNKRIFFRTTGYFWLNKGMDYQ